jgi:DNA polymerase I-like protein with 3'-5' exonuclease and polymerase domains
MDLIGLDIETHDPLLKDQGVSWVYGQGHVIVAGAYSNGRSDCMEGGAAANIVTWLKDKNVTVVGANIGYDLGWLCYANGIKATDIKCRTVDVQIAESFIDEYADYSLDALAKRYLGECKGVDKLEAAAKYHGLRGDPRAHLQKLWDLGHQELIKEYVKSDARQAALIWEAQQALIPEESLETLEDNFELIKIALDMKQRGVRVDMDKRTQNYVRLAAARDARKRSFELEHGKVNVNSTKQLAELFKKHGIPVRYKVTVKGVNGVLFRSMDERYAHAKELRLVVNGIKVRKGSLCVYLPERFALSADIQLTRKGYMVTCNPNIGSKQLEALKESHKVAADISDLKMATSILDKFLGEDFNRFIVKHGDDNYRIHADISICGARQTGRMSYSHPNLQQVPTRQILFKGTPDEMATSEICREIFIPDSGYEICKADYSGQEQRILAHFAVGIGASEVREKYKADPHTDYHQYAGEISGLIDKYGEQVGRKYAKNLGFGLNYGMMLNTMCETFGWGADEAHLIMDMYFDALPFVRTTFDAASKKLIDRGYVLTLGGRHLHTDSESGAYKALNKIIQGSAADMTKRAVVNYYKNGFNKKNPPYLIIHDEIVFGVPLDGKNNVKEIVRIMENTHQMRVPIVVEPELGKDWAHTEKGERK